MFRLSRIFDFSILVLVLIWLLGGISIGGRLFFKHGADLRRFIILLGLAVYFGARSFRKDSWVLSWVLNTAKCLERPRWRWGIYGFGLAAALAIAILQTLAMRVTLYDVGIFHQILWGLSHGLGFWSTISMAGDFLKDHFSPTLALLVPSFYLTGQSIFFLPMMQVFLVFLGGAAWIFLAERIPQAQPAWRGKLAAATTVFVLGFDSLWGNMRWGFHENSIAFVTLSWAMVLLWVAPKQRFWIFLLFLVSAFSKETLLLDVAFALAGWAYWEKENSDSSDWSKLPWMITLSITAVILVVTFIYFEKISHPADKNYFNRYYSYLGPDLKTMLVTLATSPGTVFQKVGTLPLLKYGFTVFIPWLFLPLTRPHLGLIALLPSFASAALSTFAPLRNPDFHYVMELWPFLAPFTIVILCRKKSETWIWAWALLSVFRMDHDPWADFREYVQGTQLQAALREKLQEIPQAASVAASDLTGTWLAGRQWITRWPDRTLLPANCPQYLVIHEDLPAGQLEGCGPYSVVWKEPFWTIYLAGR